MYYSCCIISIIFGYFAAKKNNKKTFFLSTFIICFMIFLREKSVGIDTKTYYQYIDWIRQGIYETHDIGFLWFTKILLLIKDSSKFVVSVYSAMTIILIYATFWKYRDRVSVPLMQFIYLAFYLQLSLNIMRQFFSVAIVFYATTLLEKKKYSQYVIWVIIASTFHISSILGLGIMYIYILLNEKKSLKKLLYLFVALCVVPIFVIKLGSLYLDSLYIYLSKTNMNIGLMMFVKMGLLMLFVICRFRKLKNRDDKLVLYDRFIISVYFVGILLTSLGYIFTYLDRIGLTFMMYEPVCLARMSSRNKNSKIFLGIILVLCFFIIGINYSSNSNGVFPYVWGFSF